MKELLISQISSVFDAAVVACLVLVIKSIGKEIVDYLAKKKALVGHEEEVTAAWETWYEIDEKFRITDKIETFLGSKADEFDKLLLQKIPGLSQESLTSLRQAIAGQINAGKDAILNKTDVINQLEADKASLQDVNNELVAKNTALENKISQVVQLTTTSTTEAQGSSDTSTAQA